MSRGCYEIAFKSGVILFIFIVASASISSMDVVYGQQDMSPALHDAEGKIVSAFEAVAKAEGNGADVTGLINKMNDACNLLVDARILHHGGDLEGANLKAVECGVIVESVDAEAQALTLIAAEEAETEAKLTLAYSLTAIIAIILVSFLIWKRFKQHYRKQALGLKPEVLNIEP